MIEKGEALLILNVLFMQYQPNLKGASTPLIVILIIVILVIGGFLYFTAQAPKESIPKATIPEEVARSVPEALPPKEEKTMPSPAPEEGKEAAGPSVKSFDITGKNFAFSQSEIRVKKGDNVRINFTSTDGFHDWSIEGFNASTKQVNTGESASVEFVAGKAGTFEYYCSVGNHRQLGMKGNLLVE